MAGEADLILAMTEEHAEAVSHSAPHSAKKAFTLKELVNILDHSPVEAAEGTPTDRLRAAVALADHQRANGAGATTMDLDIADPLGLGIESYRATAWELDQLVERLVDTMFGADEAIEVAPEASGGVGEGRR
jgi:protein-tyrosine-phosphatase